MASRVSEPHKMQFLINLIVSLKIANTTNIKLIHALVRYQNVYIYKTNYIGKGISLRKKWGTLKYLSNK